VILALALVGRVPALGSVGVDLAVEAALSVGAAADAGRPAPS
jgi:hypothetical protein